MQERGAGRLVLAGMGALVLLVVSLLLFEFHTVEGNELGVKETWTGGVEEKAFGPRTYFLFPGFSQKIYNYDMSSQVYVMNDTAHTKEFGNGRENDSYLVQSREGQDLKISLNTRWRLDPDHVVHLHKTVRGDFEEKLLRPVLMRIVKDKATQMDAISAYSGEGLVQLQAQIEEALTDPEGDMTGRGIIVENFVIEHITLDPEYIGQIKKKQIAVQAELRAHQEQKAALAEADKAEAEARSDYNRQVVAAERDKAVGILKSEEIAQKEIVEAEAQKTKTVLAAEGEKEASVLQSEAIVALGTAEAEAKKLEFTAYSANGAEVYARIRTAEEMAKAFQNIKGYLPENMKIFTLGNSFTDAIGNVVGSSQKEDK